MYILPFLTDSPPLDHINDTVTIEEGNSVKVDCGMPYQKSDLIRWFKVKKKNINFDTNL